MSLACPWDPEREPRLQAGRDANQNVALCLEVLADRQATEHLRELAAKMESRVKPYASRLSLFASVSCQCSESIARLDVVLDWGSRCWAQCNFCRCGFCAPSRWVFGIMGAKAAQHACTLPQKPNQDKWTS